MSKSKKIINPVKVYNKQKNVIEKRLFDLLDNESPKSLYDPCGYILKSGGKRVRAMLVMLAAKAVGANYSKVYNAAMAVEILHNFTLVHDDIMDNADKRRGESTLHKKYDLSTAILAGDNLIAVAYLNLLKDCKSQCKNVAKTFTRGIIEVCEGQSLDKEFETRKNVQIDEYMLMIEKKTAALAEMCCSIGAELGGGSKSEINLLKRYGRNLGIAFQLQDDLLDIIADEKEFGKKVGGDLIEGKKTFLFLKALDSARGSDKKMLQHVIKNNGIAKKQVGKYKELYEKLGVIVETAKQVEKYTKRALSAAEKVYNNEAREMLVWLANSLLKRSK